MGEPGATARGDDPRGIPAGSSAGHGSVLQPGTLVAARAAGDGARSAALSGRSRRTARLRLMPPPGALPRPARDEFRLPDLAVGFYDWVIAFDHTRQRAWLISTGLPASRSERLSWARQRRTQVYRWLDHPQQGANAAPSPHGDFDPGLRHPVPDIGRRVEQLRRAAGSRRRSSAASTTSTPATASR